MSAIQRGYEYNYECLTSNLIAGKPPLVDANGDSIPDGSLMEVMNAATAVVDSIWTKKGGAWYKY
jgi:hypothetical protein